MTSALILGFVAGVAAVFVAALTSDSAKHLMRQERTLVQQRDEAQALVAEYRREHARVHEETVGNFTDCPCPLCERAMKCLKP